MGQRGSWLDDQKTSRSYRLANGTTCTIQNEFQIVKCRHCKETQYCRLTHIWYVTPDGQCRPEYHTNYSAEMDYLKDLLVSYWDGVGVREIEKDGKWILLKGEELVGEQVATESKG